VLAWARVLARVEELQDHECLLMGDNAGSAAMVARGRSSRFNLDIVMRRILCCAICANCRFRVPWVDTHHMPADGGTREVEGELCLGEVLFPQTCVISCVGIKKH